MIRGVRALPVIALGVSAAQGQTLTGRVTDASGAPVTHARVLVHAWGDTTEAALRVAFSNERGEYRLTLGAHGMFVLTAFNIGYKAQTERAVDLTAGDTTANIVLQKLPPTLASVTVSDHSCVPLDSPYQSERVRDWVHQVQNLIRSRRAIEREYEYHVHESFASHNRDFVQRPADTSHVGEVPAYRKRTDGPIALSQNLDYWAVPSEDEVIGSYFTSSAVCFDTTLVHPARDVIEVQFRISRGHSGALRTTGAGMLTEIRFDESSRFWSALTYAPISIDGETFPFIARAQLGGDIPVLRQFAYSNFVRVPPQRREFSVRRSALYLFHVTAFTS